MTQTATRKARNRAERLALAAALLHRHGAARCPHCGEVARMTRDHIIKQQFGGKSLVHGDVRNIRPMCQECNNLVDQCGQCVGALACIRAVGPAWETSKAWRMSYVAETMRAA